MVLYSLLLTLGLVASAPWWGVRMLRSGRYREGLGERLGRGTGRLQAEVAGRRVVWVHAVSVGEVLAVGRLVEELGKALPGWCVVVSTTTATGQAVARKRFGAARVFYFPLDFGFAVRAWMRALQPGLVVLVESELWPRLLAECEGTEVPVAVVNARVSDRSFRRSMKVRKAWAWMAGKVTLFLAQGEETAGRLRALGVAGERVIMPGNLKYDLEVPRANHSADWIRDLAGDRPLLVAGSTLGGSKDDRLTEEQRILQAWEGGLRQEKRVMLVLAPRHPERFGEVRAVASEYRMVAASEGHPAKAGVEIVLLDTLGDLAAVYGVADVAFVGGSLVGRGGHNPLEAARYGVPVVMGESYENFREMVEGMREGDAIRIVTAETLGREMIALLDDDGGMGERGKMFYDAQAGATGRTVEALLGLVGGVG